MKLTLIATAIAGLIATSAFAGGHSTMNFNRIASFPVVENMANGEDRGRETSSEIIAATADGMTLVYTDSPLNVIGMIDISNPRAPRPLGNVGVGGEPTSVAVVGQMAFVGVNTSESYVKPSGYVAVINLATKAVVQQCDLGGQPDSIAAAKDGSFIAIAIENERDEDLNDGEIPQLPAGNLTMFDTTDSGLNCN